MPKLKYIRGEKKAFSRLKKHYPLTSISHMRREFKKHMLGKPSAFAKPKYLSKSKTKTTHRRKRK